MPVVTLGNWCSKWRMAVNGSKTEPMLWNWTPTAIEVPGKSDSCAVTQETKPLGLTIDDRFEYKVHARSVITKAMGTWNHFRSKSSRSWGLPLKTQTLLHRAIIQPQALYGFPVWGQKTRKISKFSKTRSFTPYYKTASHHKIQHLSVSSVFHRWTSLTIDWKWNSSSKQDVMAQTWSLRPTMIHFNYKGAQVISSRAI